MDVIANFKLSVNLSSFLDLDSTYKMDFMGRTHYLFYRLKREENHALDKAKISLTRQSTKYVKLKCLFQIAQVLPLLDWISSYIAFLFSTACLPCR